MIYQTVKIDASKFYHRAYLPKRKPFVFSPTRQGIKAVAKWLREIAPDCRPVFSVDLLQPFGAIVTRLILGAGCAVRITDC